MYVWPDQAFGGIVARKAYDSIAERITAYYLMDNGSHFDGFGTCADNNQNFHFNYRGLLLECE
jgi:hypothetical protein